MDRTKVIELAREAGFQSPRLEDKTDYFMLDRFAALVAAHEREQCAKACEKVGSDAWKLWESTKDTQHKHVEHGAAQCTFAIIARGEVTPPT